VKFSAFWRCSVSAMWRLGLADDEAFAGGFDDLARDRREVVDLEDAPDLGKEAVDEPEVAVGDPGDGGDRLGVGEVLGGEFEAERAPVVGQDEPQLFGAERPVLVGEADAALELRVAGEAFLEAGHADQDQSDPVAVEEVAQRLERGGLDAVGFVDDEQLDVGAFGRVAEELARRVQVLVDGVVQPASELLDLVVDPAWGDPDGGRVERGAGVGQFVWWRVFVAHVVAVEPGFELVPGGVVAGGEGLADAGRAVADADVALAAAGVGELGEAAVLLGDQKRGRRWRRAGLARWRVA
jgi:hypothetical protein